MSIEVVIPVGPGDPEFDTPNPRMLEDGLRNVKSEGASLVVAVDRNLPSHKIELIKSIADKTVMFEPHSYYNRGGIWNKIYTCWEQSTAEYVAWQGYDDFSSGGRFLHQRKVMDDSKANACFCSNFSYSDGVNTFVNDGKIDFKAYLGSHPPYMGAFLLRRSSILQSGLNHHRLKWAYYFEGLLYTYILKTGRPAVSSGAFHYRHHQATISNTAREEKQWVKDARKTTNYSLQQTINDWKSINFEHITSEVRL